LAAVIGTPGLNLGNTATTLSPHICKAKQGRARSEKFTQHFIIKKFKIHQSEKYSNLEIKKNHYLKSCCDGISLLLYPRIKLIDFQLSYGATAAEFCPHENSGRIFLR
jgi:hypothetical protein